VTGQGVRLRGIVSKRADSLYECGKRSGAWSKYRVNKGQEFAIGGYVPGNPFDSIIVGYLL
jgi:bifunctional non-homologous end joining protein LigD